MRHGPVDIVLAEPIDRNYSYGPSLAERNLRAASATTASFVITYDAGFAANPQAQAAFQAAANVWGTVLVSAVPIRVSASFRALGQGVLGSAGPTYICTSASGVANTFYANALADKLAGSDACAAGSSEISANFSSTFTNWDYGTAGLPVVGKYSFMTVVLHELGHGLGFYGSMDSSGGLGSWGETPGRPDIYDRFAYTRAGQSLLSFTSPSAALAAQLVSGDVFFAGSNASLANNSSWPKLESSLNPFDPGSSYSHLDDRSYTGTPNGLMTYALGMAEVYTDPGPITRGIFVDEGWTVSTATATVPGAPSAFTTSAVGTTVTMSWRAPTTGGTPTSYNIVSGSASGRSDLANFSTGSTATSFSADRVGLGTYYVRVRAVNAAGTSADSNESILVVGGGTNPGAGVPGAPTSFVTSASGTTITMTWRAPTTGGTPTTYYIASGSASGLSDLAYFSTGSTATSFSADRVGLGTYYVRVRAANAAGTGPDSNESILVVGTNANLPGAPEGFAVSAFGTTITMTWRPPSTGGTPTGYIIESGSSSGLSDLAVIPIANTATFYTAERVGRGTYFVRLRAVNAFGTGPASNEAVLVVR